MNAAGARRLAVSLVIAVAALDTGSVLLGRASGTLTVHGVTDLILTVTVFVCTIVFALSGTLIVARQPRNTIGWILIAIPLLAEIGFFVGDYATYALVTRHGALPLGLFAAWVDRWAIVPALCMFIPLFLLFPDGRIPSRRWRPVLWLAVGAPALTTLAFALTPGRMTGASASLQSVQVTNPLGLDAAAGLVRALTAFGGALSVLAAFLVGAALVSRYRSRQGDERQQVKWLTVVGVTFLAQVVLAATIGAVLGDQGAGNVAGNVVFSLMFFTLGFGIPIACGMAILKYHLYDLDVVVKKTVVFAALAVFITLVYVGIVVGLPAVLGIGGSDTPLSFVAAVVLAVLFQPVRDRARRLADRLVYGKRASPYEVLSEFSERIGDAYSTEDVLPRMVALLAQGTGASEARVWLRDSDELVSVGSFPDDQAAPALGRVAAPGDTLPPFEGATAVPVTHQGESLGAIAVRMPPADPLTPPKEQLLRDFAAQAGHVLRNVRLIQDLKASRQRLVAARDAERRALERNIHDGAQQQLVALAVKSRLVATVAAADGAPRTAALLDEVRSQAQRTLEDLRDLARGIYPPLLADQGLRAALEAQARKSEGQVLVDGGEVGRFPQEVEATFYFCALEALRNVARHACATRVSVRLWREGGKLCFEVSDDGVGFDPATTSRGSGLTNMSDRLEALGGALTVNARPGGGTGLIGFLPIGDPELSP